MPFHLCRNTLIDDPFSFYEAAGSMNAGVTKNEMHAWGLAIQIKKLDGDFVGFDRIRTDKVMKPACDSCCDLFKRLGINYYDLCDLRVIGDVPKGYEKDHFWTRTVRFKHLIKLKELTLPAFLRLLAQFAWTPSR